MSETPSAETPQPTAIVPPPPPPRRLRLVQILTLLILVGAFAGTIYLLGDEARRRQLEELIQSPSGLLVLFAIAAISKSWVQGSIVKSSDSARRAARQLRTGSSRNFWACRALS